MKRYSLFALLLALGLLLAGCGIQNGAGTPGQPNPFKVAVSPSVKVDGPHAPHQVIVGYTDESALQAAVSKLGGAVRVTLPVLHAALVNLPSDLTAGQALFQLRGLQGITYAQPNWQRKLLPLSQQQAVATLKQQGLAPGLNGDPTAAPYFYQEWGLKAPPDGLDVVKAWNELSNAGVGAGSYTDGNGDTHKVVLAYFAEPLPPLPDFAGQIVPGFDFTAWECGTIPNSYVPASGGMPVSGGAPVDNSCSLGGFAGPLSDPTMQVFDAPNINPNVQPGVNYNTPDNGGGEASLDASNMVANGTGITGIAFDAVLMPLVVFSDNNPYNAKLGQSVPGQFEGDFAYAAEIVWAVDHGATILNNSLGSAGASPLITAAVSYALANNVMFVASSGDNGDTLVSSPADIPGVTTVTATDEHGNLAFLSQIAPYVKFGAPGDNIISAQAINFAPCSDTAQCPLGVAPVPGYEYLAGTSSSSPYVVGIAALLQAAYQQKFGQPMTPGEVEQVLTKTGNAAPAGTQNYTSFTIPDAAKAVVYVNSLTTPLTDPNGYAAVIVTDSQGFGEPDADVILTNEDHTYYAKTGLDILAFASNGGIATNIPGVAYFLNIAPGTYDVKVAAPEILLDGDFLGTGNPADRLTTTGTLTVNAGGVANLAQTTVKLPATTLTLSLTGSDPNLQLTVGEAQPDGSVVLVTPQHGTPASGAFSINGNTQTYTLNKTHVTGLYLFGAYTGDLAPDATDSATLNIDENGQSYTVQLTSLTQGETSPPASAGGVPGFVQITPNITVLDATSH